MSFIQKTDAVVINTKLTNIGRLLLASGNLNFTRIEFGDSEVDYDFLRTFENVIDGSDLSIMRPKDANPNLKYGIPISSSDSTVTKKTIDNILPVTTQVKNTAKQRGFFTGSTSTEFTALTSSTYIKGMTTALITGVTGGTVIKVASAANIAVNNMLLIDWRNPKLFSFTNLTGLIDANYPRQFLWYKVQAVNGTDITVDRTLPDFGGNGGTDKSLIYIYPSNNAVDNYYSTGTTVGYWNYNTLSFDSTCNIGANDDVPVWNLNIVYKDTLEGITNSYTPQYYDSAVFSGFKEYLQGLSNDGSTSRIAIIHYTNKSISNYYGEGFYNNTFKIDLPTIMYHGKTERKMGIVLSADTQKRTELTILTGFTTEYYKLVESTSQNEVGKVFNDLRIAVIEDEELVNVLALKSDRSHTLPLLNWQPLSVTSPSTNSLIPKNSTQYVALTYLFTNENGYNGGYDTNTSLGLRGGIHCGYIGTIFPSNTTDQNVQFSFKESDLKFMVSNMALSDGTGFNANKFYVLAQKVNLNLTPNPATWKLIDFTPKLQEFSLWGAFTIPSTALTFNYTLNNDDYTGGTTYNIENWIGTLPTTGDYSSTPKLGFGEESILLGNINTEIKATVYKTKMSHILGFNEYNTSNNPTWDSSDSVYITEAAIYDQNNSLVAIGKLNNPIKKSTNKLFTVELDMDF